MSDQVPPGAHKTTTRDSKRQPRQPAKKVYLLDSMAVRDLASALGLKPFHVVADLMELKVLKSADDSVDFETASVIARKHGYRPERPPPGELVLY
jgi:translation initiation factor IF-2-like protein